MSQAEIDLLRMLGATFGERFADLRATLLQHATDRYAIRSVETISKIVVHHSDTSATTKWSAIAAYHINDKDHRWPGIGYHFGIESSGMVVYLGDIETIRYHARQANTASIGICCLGAYQKVPPSMEMLDSLRRLIALLNRWHQAWTGNETCLLVAGHRDECETTCPGDLLYAKLTKLEVNVDTIDPTNLSWDSDLDAVRIDGNLVRGLKCGVFKPTDLADGDVYYKLIGASFIDEEESRGRHLVTVDVVDENFNRVQGARVWHGWPTERWPQFDERVQTTIFGSQLAEWGLYANFDAWVAPGPYWVQCADGKSDAFWGAGLPWNRHVCFVVVFQRTVYQTQPIGTLKEVLLALGQQLQVIQFNPDAALQKAIFADSFVPNSPEFDAIFGGVTYVAQRAENLDTGQVRVYYAPVTNYNQVAFVVR